jgi:hypothetical protein
VVAPFDHAQKSEQWRSNAKRIFRVFLIGGGDCKATLVSQKANKISRSISKEF